MRQSWVLIAVAVCFQGAAASPHGGSTLPVQARKSLQQAKQTYTKLDYIPETLSGEAECRLSQATFQGKVLQSGVQHKARWTDECRQQCRKHENCTAWTYCQDWRGCVDEQGTRLPENGCQLKWEPRQPWGIPQEGALVARPSTYASGYVKRRSPTQRTFIRQHSAPSTPMILALSMHPDGECSDAQGPQMQQLTLLSRQDYARWHSYELHVVTQGVSGVPKDKTGHFNKIAFIKKLLDETDPSVAEWILYVEPEMIIDAPDFTFPFEFYAGRDLVIVGDPVKMRQGDPKALDTGTFLIRNSERSKQLLQQLADVADQFQDGSQYDVVKLAMLHLFNLEGSHWASHMHFETEFCMDCDWERVDLGQSDKTEITKVWGDQNKRWKLFITRFFNCEVCYGRMDKGGLAKCQQSFREHYEFASCRSHRLAAAVEKEAQHGVPLQHLAEMVNVQGFDSDRWVQAQPKDNEILQQTNVQDAQTCYDTCAGDTRCDFWVWCNQATGCDHNHAFDGRYPYHSCSIIRLHRGLPPYEWQRGPQASTFASGYMRQEHSARTKDKEASAKQLVTLTGIPTAPCSTPWGDHLISLAVQNKQDWARLHGHELHLMAASTDVRIRPGAWQKVGLLRQAMRSIPRERAEWIVWIDMDVVLGDIGFTFPLTKDSYRGKDFIVWGNYDAVLAGDTYNGLNGGIMLFRNTDWSREYLDSVAHYGQFPPNMTTEQVLQAALPSYDIGMFEQNAAVYVLMQSPASMANVYFEHSYCINCWYKDLDSPLIVQPAFVIHYAGCQMCSGLHTEKLGACAAIYVRTFAEAFSRLVSLAELHGL